MKRNDPQKVEGVMPAYFEALGIMDKINEARLMLKWNEQMGEVIGRKTTHLEVKNRVLYVSLTSSVVRYELFCRRDALRDEINRVSGVKLVSAVIIR
mgnify:CR=1 FL=1